MDQAAIFLAGSILVTMGFIVLVIGAVIINYILHKYWKPIPIFKVIDPNVRFIDSMPDIEKSTNERKRNER
jgi:hypothetical protein